MSVRSPSPLTRLLRGLFVASACALAFVACGSGALVVGDDTRDAGDGASPDGTVLPDATLPDASDAATDVDLPDAADDVPCPTLSPPGPGFCDGGPFAARYDARGCIVGFLCAPASCTSAGGSCVGLAPSSCPDGHFGDATKYDCGGGIGSACCLPGK
jgi:hypothetical protein